VGRLKEGEATHLPNGNRSNKRDGRRTEAPACIKFGSATEEWGGQEGGNIGKGGKYRGKTA